MSLEDRLITDTRETETLARALLEHAAGLNSTGRPSQTVALAIQMLVAPLRYDGSVSSAAVLSGAACALGTLVAMASPDPNRRAICKIVVGQEVSRVADLAAAELTPPPRQNEDPGSCPVKPSRPSAGGSSDTSRGAAP